MVVTNNTDSSLPTTPLPPITSYPVDGYGGSYYDIRFPVPVYSPISEDIYNTMSWSDIDSFYRFAATKAIEPAVTFGICMVTLLNVIILTPQPKRRLPIHSLICLALIFQIVRNATDMMLMSKSLPASSYIYLTVDLEATTISHMFHGLLTTNQISACLAFMFVQACFFVQGRALMTWLQLHYYYIYLSTISYLVLSGLIATGFRIGFAAIQIRLPLKAKNSDLWDDTLRKGTLITYGLSIGSWSLVFFVSTITTIVNRRQKLFKGNSIYDAALNLVALIGLESFIVPILFCIMDLLPVKWTVNKPEQLILPAVLFLLPMGSLFLTIHSNAAPISTSAPLSNQKSTISRLSSKKNLNDDYSHVSSNPRTASRMDEAYILAKRCAKTTETHPVPPLARPKNAADQFEVELASIDAMEEHGECTIDNYEVYGGDQDDKLQTTDDDVGFIQQRMSD